MYGDPYNQSPRRSGNSYMLGFSYSRSPNRSVSEYTPMLQIANLPMIQEVHHARISPQIRKKAKKHPYKKCYLELEPEKLSAGRFLA